MEDYINSLLGNVDKSVGSSVQSKDKDKDKEIVDSSLDTNESLPDPDNHDITDQDEIGRPLLPFPFANRFNVFVLKEGNHNTLYHKNTISIPVIAEIQRHLGIPFVCKNLSDNEYDKLISRAYENRNNEAMQMVEDLGDEMDLATLADSVPESDDLLEQEDDAPIIRLINALLTEAVKENASDIHIETFEKALGC